MDEVLDSVRRRLSFTPSPSRTPTPGLRRPDSRLSRLSKAEIDEIIDSPFETNYTYSESAAYKPHIGPREYIHPRLCRRFPTPSAPPGPASPGQAHFRIGQIAWQWYQSAQSNFTNSLVAIVQLIAIFIVSGLQFALQPLSLFFYRSLRYIAILILKYTILWPILAPYYAVKSYWNKARLVWRATRSIWYVGRWSWGWWTGERWPPEEERQVGVRTRSMEMVAGRGGGTDVRETDTRETIHLQQHKGGSADRRHSLLLWLLLYLPLFLLLLWAGHRLLFHAPSEPNGASAIRVGQALNKTRTKPIERTPAEEHMPNIPPSNPASTFPHLAHQIGQPDVTPGLGVHFEELGHQMEKEGRSIGQKIGNFFWTLFSPIGNFISTILNSFKKIVLYLLDLPMQIGFFLWKWVFIPVGKAGRNFTGSMQNWTFNLAEGIAPLLTRIWNFLNSRVLSPLFHGFALLGSTTFSGMRSVAENIASVPAKLWNLWDKWVLTPIWQFIVDATSIGFVGIKKSADYLVHLPATIWSFLVHRIYAPISHSVHWIGAKLSELPDAVAIPIHWIGSTIGQIAQGVWNGICAFGQLFSDKAVSLYSLTTEFISGLTNSTFNGLRMMRTAAVNLLINTFSLVGWTGEKLLDGLLFAKDGVISMVKNIATGFCWIGSKSLGGLKYTLEYLGDAGTVLTGTLANCLWWPIDQVSSFIKWSTKNIAHFYVNICHWLGDAFGRVRSQLSQLMTPRREGKRQQEPPAAGGDEYEHLLSPSPELGELPDNHPLLRRLRQIILQTFAEERYFVDQRIRKMVEHNVLVMKSQLRQLEPKLVEETKERVEAELTIPPSATTAPIPSPEELKRELKTDLEGELRTMLDQRDRGQQQNEQMHWEQMEQQIEEKIRHLVSQLSKEVRNYNTRVDVHIGQEQEGGGQKQQLGKGAQATGGQENIVTVEGRIDEGALLDKVRQLVKQELRKFDADRTGMADYALESSGGSVLSTRCTVQYNERSRTQKLFGIPLWHSSYSPRSVIQRKGYGASAGECWAYHGGHGFLTIGLSKRINVTAVSYEHLPVELSPDGQIRTAPKNFLIWSYQDVDDMNSRLLLGNCTYDANGDPLQLFPLQKYDPRGTQIIELETLTNWGAPVTCLYRFRVHGDNFKVIPEENDLPAADGRSQKLMGEKSTPLDLDEEGDDLF